MNKSGWSQRNLRVEKKKVTNDRQAPFFQITPHTLTKGDEKPNGVRGVWGALLGVWRSLAQAGGEAAPGLGSSSTPLLSR